MAVESEGRDLLAGGLEAVRVLVAIEIGGDHEGPESSTGIADGEGSKLAGKWGFGNQAIVRPVGTLGPGKQVLREPCGR
jgi:hypothetical protein